MVLFFFFQISETAKTDIKLHLLDVPKNQQNSENDNEHTSADIMGDMIDNKNNATNNIMHDQMKNELEVLRLADKTSSIQMEGIAEADSPITPKQNQSVSTPHELEENKSDENTSTQNLALSQNTDDTVNLIGKSNVNDENNTQNDGECKMNEEKLEKEIEEIDSQSEPQGKTSGRMSQTSSLPSTEIQENHSSDDIAETEPKTCIDYLKPMQSSQDAQSSDLSDTDTATTDKAEKVYTESGVDETSRDERDEVSEIENFDLSSCGEDSLEAMYYMIRKNEIIMDRHKQDSANMCEDEKITFPEKATDDIERAVREVSGKNIKLCSIGSMNSSTDEIVLKKLSSDSDELQLHIIPNSEIDSSSDPKTSPLKGTCTANESTDDEYINPIVDSMRKNEDALNEMHAKALSVQPNHNDTDDHQFETDTFNEHLMDDMVPGNIERKILASSVSEADSDYFELPSTAHRLTKDDFNVSTAFEHMTQTESTTDESDSTIESAATKIQAGARGFLTRRRIRRSSAGTSASNEKCSSFGNAAIDKSLDNLAEQHELMDERAYSTSFDPNISHDLPYDQSVDRVFGITEVKIEQRIDDASHHTADKGIDEKVSEINIEGISEDSATATAQRRLMLQRGDAMQSQSNSTPESTEQQQDDKEKLNEESNTKEKSLKNPQEVNKHDDDPKIATPLANGKKNCNNIFEMKQLLTKHNLRAIIFVL